MNDCEALALFADARIGEAAGQAIAGNAVLRIKLAIGGSIAGFESYDTAAVELSGADIDSPARGSVMQYTSGTTGRAKGVIHSHNTLHALIKQLGEQWHIAPGDRFLVPSPISHIGGSIYAFECPLPPRTIAR